MAENVERRHPMQVFVAGLLTMSGIPILLGVDGEAADIVRRENVGIVFPPENADSLVDGLVRMRGDKAARAGFAERAVAGAQRFDRAVLARQLLELLARVAHR